MGSVSIPRLYRKRCGTYLLRVLVPDPASSPGTDRRKRSEVRLSLRTKVPGFARAIAAWANARLEQASTMAHRHDILADIRQFTINVQNGTITTDGEQDARAASDFLDRHPEIKQALVSAKPEPALAMNEMQRLMLDLIEQRHAGDTAQQRHHPGLPANPMRVSAAVGLYQQTVKLKERTLLARSRLVTRLGDHVSGFLPSPDPDPFLHLIEAHHVASFFDAESKKKAASGVATEAEAAPRTLVKKKSDLSAFFDWAVNERQATLRNPTEGLAGLVKRLKKEASEAPRHYKPFTSEQLSTIFEPRAYLAENRKADTFWAPLISLHMGMRLAEVVTLEVHDFGREPETGVWYLEITRNRAKTNNSERPLALPQRLIELGLLDYIRHVEALGADQLFPHVNFQCATLRRTPSKNVTRDFGAYLRKHGLKDEDPDLVFHSFRHTVTTALADADVPLGEAMQITGHSASAHAVKTNRVSRAQTRSVHFDYLHQDKPRLNVDSPLRRMKAQLDRSIQADLDYARLRKAADLVRKHTVRMGAEFRSGWSKLGKAHPKLLEQLDL